MTEKMSKIKKECSEAEENLKEGLRLDDEVQIMEALKHFANCEEDECENLFNNCACLVRVGRRMLLEGKIFFDYLERNNLRDFIENYIDIGD